MVAEKKTLLGYNPRSVFFVVVYYGRSMTTQPNDALMYLAMYPGLHEKLNQCIACQRQGIKPGVFHPNLQSYFPEMAINQEGFCEQCEGAMRRKNRDPR